MTEVKTVLPPGVAIGNGPETPELNKDSGRDGGFVIHMEQNVHDELTDFARSAGNNGLGGILLGQVLTDHVSTLVLVQGCVVAEREEGQQGCVTFNDAAWMQMHREKEQGLPDSKIVGWFHTHQDLGLSLSSQDKLTQSKYFTHSWQVAYVLDPVNNTEGCFQSAEGIFTAVEYKIVTDPERPKPKVFDCLHCINTQHGIDQKKPGRLWLGGLIGLLLIMLCLSNIYFGNNTRQSSARIGELQQYVSSLENTNRELSEQVNKTRDWHHTVIEGETLADISNKYYGSEDYLAELATLNNITDLYSLQTGQEIRIPAISKQKESSE